MKQIFLLLVIILFHWAGRAQPTLSQQIKQTQKLTGLALGYAQDAAEELGFYQGALDFEEVKTHLYQARIAMDSLSINLTRAGYVATDASYTAHDLKQEGLRQQIIRVKTTMDSTTIKLEKVKKQIDMVFTNPPYNLDTYLFQPFQQYDQIQNKLFQSYKKLKTIQRSANKINRK